MNGQAAFDVAVRDGLDIYEIDENGLRARFGIRRGCAVADRGMISAEVIAALEERKLEYILGTRERTDKLVRTVMLVGALAQILAFTQQSKTAAASEDDGRVLMVAGACNPRELTLPSVAV